MTDKFAALIESHAVAWTDRVPSDTPGEYWDKLVGCRCGVKTKTHPAHVADVIRAAGQTTVEYMVEINRDDGELSHFTAEYGRDQAFKVADSERKDGFSAQVKSRTSTLIVGDWAPEPAMEGNESV